MPRRYRLSLPLWCPQGARAALAIPATVVPAGGACLLCRPPALPLVSFPAPYPPSPLPRRGRGGIKVIFMQGAPPLASPRIRPFAALTEPAKQVPSGGRGGFGRLLTLPLWCPQGGLNPRGTGYSCRCGARRGACLLCRPPALPLVSFPAPYPPDPLPRWGRGGI